MIEIAIDLGGTFTRIYEKNSGLILEEPTLIAVEQFDEMYEFYAMGQDAKKIQTKAPENVIIFSPLFEGKVKSIDYASELLKEFLYKNFTKSQIKNISSTVLVPCGITKEEREDYRNVCYSAGILKCELVPKIICASIQAGLDIDNNTAFMVDIGGNSTDVASISGCSILQGCTTNIAGNIIDKQIQETIKEQGVLVNKATASKLKEEIATLSENSNLRYDVVGQDEKTKTPRSAVISTANVRKILESIFEEIIKVIQTTANVSSDEISRDIVKNGIFVSGGTSNIENLERYLRKKLGVAVNVTNDGGRTAILGAGKLLSDKKTLSKIIENF